MSVELVLTPLSDHAQQILDSLEARTGKLPYKMAVETGARTYSLASEADADEFSATLAEVAPDWQEHITGGE